MMLFRRGNRKKSNHRTPLIWRPQASDQGNKNKKYKKKKEEKKNEVTQWEWEPEKEGEGNNREKIIEFPLSVFLGYPF
jgi:hypothetical protein